MGRICGPNSTPQKIVYAWARNAPALSLPSGIGYRSLHFITLTIFFFIDVYFYQSTLFTIKCKIFEYVACYIEKDFEWFVQFNSIIFLKVKLNVPSSVKFSNLLKHATFNTDLYESCLSIPIAFK